MSAPRLLGPLTCEHRPETPWPAYDPAIQQLECRNCGQANSKHWTASWKAPGCNEWSSPRSLQVGMSDEERAWWKQHLAGTLPQPHPEGR